MARDSDNLAPEMLTLPLLKPMAPRRQLGRGLITLSIGFFALCGTTEAGKPGLGPPSSPRAFSDDLKANLVASNNLWLFVTGKAEEPGTTQVRAYARRRAEWREDPTLRTTVDPDEAVIGGALYRGEPRRKRRPCIGFTTADRLPAVRCRATGGGWPELAQSPRLARFGTLADVRAAQHGLLILFRKTSRSSSVLQVIRVSPSGRIQRLGKPARTPRATAYLGLSGAPTVLVQEQRSGRRYILSLRGPRWRRATKSLRRSEGPLVGGSALVSGRRLIPVVEAGPSPWRFSTFVYGPGRGWKGIRLSRGAGDAQGNLSQPGRTAWAIWQENEYSHRRFETRIRISRYMPKRSAFSGPATVFKGVSPGPGDLQVERWNGKNFVLFMGPRKEGGRTLRAFVRRIR